MPFLNIIDKLEEQAKQYTISLKEAVNDADSAKKVYNDKQQRVDYLTTLINEMIKTIEILKKQN